MANRSWVSFTIETRLDADKEGGGDKLTSATSKLFLPFMITCLEPVMDTYKTFENGNADLQDRQGFVKKIYPGRLGRLYHTCSNRQYTISIRVDLLRYHLVITGIVCGKHG